MQVFSQVFILFLVLVEAFSEEHADHVINLQNEDRAYVIELQEEDFDTTLAAHSLILVEFYAPWCGHCKTLAPEYEKAAEVLSAINIPLAKIDATAHTGIANRYGVKGYPSLKVFHDGVAYDYEGPRIASKIVKYMQNEASPDWKPPADEVLVLTSDNFTSVVTESQLVLVEFYAPWCGHCKALEPEYKKAAADLSKHGIPLAKVDATVEVDLAKENGVDGYPTIFMFRNGKKFSYTGPRERQGIVKYMLEQSQPASSLVTSVSEVHHILHSTNLPLVLACSDTLDTFIDMANEGRESPLTFVHTDSRELCASVGLEYGATGILKPDLFKSKYETALMTFDLSKTNLSDLLLTARPLVGLRNKATQQAWFADYPLLVAYLEIDTSTEGIKDFSYWRGRLLEVARLFPDLTVAMSDEKQYQDELNSLGLSDWGEDVAIVIWAGPNERYPLGEGLDVDSITSFVEDYYAGELKPHLRSQPKPKNDRGPVATVVGSTFQDIVLNLNKHVLVEFYAPWCGHCKSLEPKYKKLAKKLQKRDDIVVAKFDATANDAMPEFKFTGFPTLFFVSAGDNEITVYDGEREVKAMADFVKKQVKRFNKQKDEL